MKSSRIILLLSLTLLIYSCSIIRLKNRKGKDLHIDASSDVKLCGNFQNSKNDTTNFSKTLYNSFNFDTVYKRKDLIVNITPIDKNKIKLKVIDNQYVIDSLTIKGKYRRGYFKMKRQYSTNFIAGPLLWILGDNFKYLGLTKDNKLIIIDSGNGGVMLLVIFPIFGSGSGQFENEFERIK